MTLRPATAGDLPVLLDLAVAFYQEDGFATPRPALAAHLRVLLDSPGRARVYYAARGFTDDGRRLLSRPLQRNAAK